MEMQMKHFSHKHPLILTDVLEAQLICKCCKKFISQDEQAYRCANTCWENYSLHVACAELPREIVHPEHPQHSLILLSKAPNLTRKGSFDCGQCDRRIEGFTYHCSLCEFDLDISCALKVDLDREIERARAREGERKRDIERGMEMQMKHFSHPHQLILKDVVEGPKTKIKCKCCREKISHEEQAYECAELCSENYFLHKVCAGLPNGIMHPRHTQHPLELLSKVGEYICNECGQIKKGFKYHCDECRFDLGICCALQFDYTIIDLDRENEMKLERERQRDRDREIERKTEKERNIGMQTKHFSHDHPLILREMLKADHEAEIMCKCCQLSISHDEQTYGCYECSKGYYLHKVCAKLPREIMHPKHSQHSLILLSISPYPGEFFECSECGEHSKGFTYHCSLCEYDLDTSCALEDNYTLVEPRMKHNGHEHSLIFLTRPCLFRCDACGVEDKDQFYLCLSCPFYLHKSCASLPITGNREDHKHTLSLAYNLPSDYHEFRFDCGVCSNRILNQYWVYYCHRCRYFVHLKCMTSMTKEQIEANSEYDDMLDDANFEEKFFKVLLDDDLLQLPATDLSEKMIKRFLLRKNKLAKIPSEIKLWGIQTIGNEEFSTKKVHWNHEEHPMFLVSDEQQNVNDNEIDEDEQILCNCCIEPVSAPYYSCAECSYFLHLACANLPKTLQHSSHPHPLILDGYPKFYSTFHCKICNMMSNGLFYECKACKYFLDVKCAALPTVIEHQHHRHPLVQFRVSSDEEYNCNGCQGRIYTNTLAFGCKTCKSFYVDIECAMLPGAIKHRWVKDPIPLRFPPHSDHPDPFMCDICEEEEEINPKRWIYYSTEPDISFHPECHPRAGENSNVKFGGRVKVSSHSHPLKYVEKATLKSICDDCGRDVKSSFAFECLDCNFCLCRWCLYKSVV